MSYNEAETRYHLIDPVLRDKGYVSHQTLRWKLPPRSSPPAPRAAAARVRAAPTTCCACRWATCPSRCRSPCSKPRRRAKTRSRACSRPKGYADCQRFDVKYVFATNGHRYGEFDCFTSLQGGPFPFADFPPHQI